VRGSGPSSAGLGADRGVSEASSRAPQVGVELAAGVVGPVGLWGQLEASAALVFGVGGEHPVRVQVGEDPLPQLAQLAWSELGTAGNQTLLRLSQLFDRHRARQLLHDPADLTGLLSRQRAGGDRDRSLRQDRWQAFTGDRDPKPEVACGCDPPRRGLRGEPEHGLQHRRQAGRRHQPR